MSSTFFQKKSTMDDLNFFPLRHLITLRWVALLGQAATIFVVWTILDYKIPLAPVIIILSISVVANLVLGMTELGAMRLTIHQIPYYLIYDIAQLAALLYVTGGLNNPFCLLLLAPTSMGSAILPKKSVFILVGLAIGAVLFLWGSPYPLPWIDGGLVLPKLLQMGVALGLTIALIFISYYVWQVVSAARQLQDALLALQLALAREQKVSSLGALAAAAAHELGSPLNTIALASKELLVGRPHADPAFEDIALIAAQSDRCRDILQQLSRDVSMEHQMPFEEQPLSSLIEFAAAPHKRGGITVKVTTEGVNEPRVRLSPELLHGLGNILQNGIQFAKKTVTVTIICLPEEVSVLVQDDGPGYSAQAIDRLGEPYHTSRLDDEGGTHLGLGLFIAQTLLIQKGAALQFYNDAGACCLIKWARKDLEGDISHDSLAA